MLGIVAALVITPVLIPATQTFGQEEKQQDDEIAPAPPSIGADIPLTFWPCSIYYTEEIGRSPTAIEIWHHRHE